MIKKNLVNIFAFLFFLSGTVAQAQTPAIRSSTPVNKAATINSQAKKDTVPVFIDVQKINPALIKNAWANMYSLLEFSNFSGSKGSAEFPLQWEFKKSDTKEINDNPISKNWKKALTWRRIPPGTSYGRWEISEYPFPLNYDPGFSGIIRTGIIETTGADSVYFEINYIDGANIKTRTLQPNSNKESITKVKQVRKLPDENTEAIKNGSRPPKIYAGQPAIDVSSAMKLFTDGTRKFYIRIVPLNTNKQPLPKISNEITLQEVFFKGIEPPKPQIYLANDYTITAVKYVPVHQRETNFSCCVVVTGYDETKFPDNVKEITKSAFPIGRVICPQPPADKAWYEKAFNGVTGFIAESINDAANYYNETKKYVKDKAVSTLCSKAPSGTKGGCEIAAGAAFEYGMAAVGIPPSIPNIDDLTKLAEGELVELAVANIESEYPVPAELKEKFKKEFHDNVVASAAKGTMSDGMLFLKPHPRGEFQTAYLEIEVTRTSDLFKGKGIVSFSIDDNTTRTFNAWNPTEKKSQTVNLSINLFEHTSTKVPFLEKTGDKTIIYVVLKPQESFTWNDKNSGVLKSVNKSPQIGEYYTPSLPTYESYTNTSGFQIMCNGGSLTKFSFGLKTEAGIIPVFTNK